MCTWRRGEGAHSEDTGTILLNDDIKTDPRLWFPENDGKGSLKDRDDPYLLI